MYNIEKLKSIIIWPSISSERFSNSFIKRNLFPGKKRKLFQSKTKKKKRRKLSQKCH